MEKSSELFIRKLTHILVKHGALAIKEEHPLDQAFKKTDQNRYDMFLLEEGIVTAQALLKALSEYFEVPSFDVTDFFFDHALLLLFPKALLLNNACIPAELDEDILVVVAADPQDANLLVVLGEYVSYDIRFCVGIYQDICDAVEEFYDKSVTQVDEDDQPEDEANFDLEINEVGEIVDED